MMTMMTMPGILTARPQTATRPAPVPTPRAMTPAAGVMAAEPAAPAAAGDAQAELACIQAVKAGDVNAYQSLVEAHQARVYNLALHMLGDDGEAQDAAQDAFVQAYVHLASYRPEWRFKTWIMSITSNLCIDRLRRRRIEPLAFSDQPDPDADFVSREPQPDAVASDNERRRLVQRMLQELPPGDRSLVAMFYWAGMSYEDIARATRTTVAAVKSRLFRARRALANSPLAGNLADGGQETRAGRSELDHR